jgi:2,4-dienoyl-CoA reductase-like NADH-dependent reductase (Old Yellow Enzyme family)
MPLFVRISATDWADGGWGLEDSIVLARALRDEGVDLIDCSSGGAIAGVTIPVAPGYQVPFAEAVRREAGIRTSAVGRITEPEQAEAILRARSADAVMLGRAFLRDPRWAQRAALLFDETERIAWPPEYHTALP